MKSIRLTLTLGEVNEILELLGQQPWVRVHETVTKIQQQAQAQMQGVPEGSVTSLQLTFTLDEVNEILELLGQQPYVQVHQLIAKIQQQASTQTQAGAEGSGHTPPNPSPEEERERP